MGQLLPTSQAAARRWDTAVLGPATGLYNKLSAAGAFGADGMVSCISNRVCAQSAIWHPGLSGRTHRYSCLGVIQILLALLGRLPISCTMRSAVQFFSLVSEDCDVKMRGQKFLLA